MSATKDGTYVAETIADHKEQILAQIAMMRDHLDHLERAVNDNEITNRGIGIGWVDNVARPLGIIERRVIEVDALARARVIVFK